MSFLAQLYRFANHNVQLYRFSTTSQKNFLRDLEAHFPVDDGIDGVATLQVTGTAFFIRLSQYQNYIPIGKPAGIAKSNLPST